MVDPKEPDSSPSAPTPTDEFYELSDLENCDLTSLNGKTIGQIHPDGGDDGWEEDDDDFGTGKKMGVFRRGCHFFMTGPGATFIILMGFASLVGIFGGIGYAMRLTTPVLYGLISVWTLSLLFAFLLASLAVIRISLNMIFRLFGLISHWNWLHYAKELEPHLAGMIWLSGCLIGCYHIDHLLLAPNPEVKPLIAKIVFAGLVLTICLAVKSHYMRSLAMSFNYENYRDRIEVALRTDRVMQLLWRSRHTYKFRKRIRRVEQRPSGGGNTFWRPLHKQAAVSAASTISESRRPSSVAAVEKSNEISPGNTLLGSPKTTPSLPCLSIQAQPGQSPATQQQQHSNAASAKSTTLTEAEKKENFVCFSKLAAKTMGNVSTGASDFRAENNRQSRKQAAKLFKYMKPDDRAYLSPQDLRVYVEDEADFQFLLGLLKKNIKWQNVNPGTDDFVFGERALRKLIQWGLNECVMIVKSMQSIETALIKVDWIFSVVICLLVGLGCSIMFGNAIQLLLAMATFLSGAAFIFSTTAKNAFESLVFLLLLHPFDVGDRVFVNLNTFITPTASTIPSTMSGSEALDNLLVVEMHLLSTVFERWDGVRLYVPNYVLAIKPVFNIRRSGPLVELQRIQISFNTPIEKINELRERLDRFVRSDRTDFTDLSRVNFDAIESCNKIHLNVIAQYTGNWQDIDKQLAFRSRFLMFIKGSLEDLGIGYEPPVQRIAFVDGKGKPIQGGMAQLLA